VAVDRHAIDLVDAQGACGKRRHRDGRGHDRIDLLK